MASETAGIRAVLPRRSPTSSAGVILGIICGLFGATAVYKLTRGVLFRSGWRWLTISWEGRRSSLLVTFFSTAEGVERSLVAAFPQLRGKKISGLIAGDANARVGPFLPLSLVGEWAMGKPTGLHYHICVDEKGPMPPVAAVLLEDLEAGVPAARNTIRSMMHLRGFTRIKIPSAHVFSPSSADRDLLCRRAAITEQFWAEFERNYVQPGVESEAHFVYRVGDMELGPSLSHNYGSSRGIFEYRAMIPTVHEKIPEREMGFYQKAADQFGYYHSIGLLVLRVLLEEAGVDARELAQLMAEAEADPRPTTSQTFSASTFFINYYRASSAPVLSFPHIDQGLVTVSPTGSRPGVDVLDPALGSWIMPEEKMEPNEVLIFCGAALGFLSHGYYAPLIHRMLTEPGKPRMSMPLFVRLHPGQTMSALSIGGERHNRQPADPFTTEWLKQFVLRGVRPASVWELISGYWDGGKQSP